MPEEREYMILGTLNDPERLLARIFEQHLAHKPLELSVTALESNDEDPAAEQLELRLVEQKKGPYGHEFTYHPQGDPSRTVKIMISNDRVFITTTTP